MKTKKKNFIRAVAATIAAVLALLPVISNVKTRAWGTPIGDGTIHMTHNSKCARLYHSGNPDVDSNCNAKAVVKDGHWIPVYCIEKGKYLNDTDYVTASMYSNSEWCSLYNMSVRDAIGMIYVCGYNGENGWGQVQEGIFNHDADDDTLMANSNYHKYVATQALIWEVITGNTYYSRNSSVQRTIDTLRARIRNYQNRDARAASTTGSVKVYKSVADAQANLNKQTSVDSDGTAHFAYGYSSYYNPSNSSDNTNWNLVQSSSTSDFSTKALDNVITLGWTRIYGSNAEGGQAGERIYTLDSNNADSLRGVVVWKPGNGNQLTISATASSEKVYAAFTSHIDRTMYTANATISTTKVDDKGNSARGAVFTVYQADGSVLGTMTDSKSDGHYSFSLNAKEFSDDEKFYFDNDQYGHPITTPITRKYTVKETSPATEVYTNGAWKKVALAPNGETYTINVTLDRALGKMTWTASGTNGGSANRAGRTTVGNITFGTSNQSGRVVNVPYVYANAAFSIVKVDNLGRSARGAEFTVYSDQTCKNAVGTMTDANKDGHYRFAGINFDKVTRTTTTPQSKVYYIKETKPANEVLFDSEWIGILCQADSSVQKVTIAWTPSSGAMEATLEKNGAKTATVKGSYNEQTLTSTISADFSTNPVVNSIASTGSVRIEKFDDLTSERLTGATFCIYTDENNDGKFDEDDTIYCEALTDEDGDGIYTLEGLPLDRCYLVKEVDAPEFYETDPNYYPFKLTPKNRDFVIDNADWSVVEGVEGEFLNHNPIIGTELKDEETQDHIAVVRNEITLVDTVSFHGLHVGESYVMTGVLFDKETSNPVTDEDGNPITSSVVFVPKEVDGTVDVEFTVNTETLRNKTIVAAELVRHEESEKWVGIHFNLEDEAQTVQVPDIHTTLLDISTGTHVAPQSEEITLEDTVTYENLIPGKKYTMTGTLVNQKTGEPLEDEEGEVISTTVEFTPDERDGSVKVSFKIDSSLLRNAALVAFETLKLDDTTIAMHHDIYDEGQTVRIPDIHTTLRDKSMVEDDDMREMTRCDTEVTLVDSVHYENLNPELEYTVFGTLMVKETNELLLDQEGNPITASATFIPEKADGEVEVEFTFSTEGLGGKHIIAFETLEYNEVTLVVHADIDDVEQTVIVPKIGTTAMVAGEKVFLPGETITLTDTVHYENLIPGKTYELDGQVMLSNGEPFAPQAKAVVSTIRFVPESSDGSIDVAFAFYGKKLKKDNQLVVFEKMYLVSESIDENGKPEEKLIEITSHEDLNDEGQTVTVDEAPKPTATPTPTPTPEVPQIPKTGDTGAGNNILIGLLAILAGGAIAFVALKNRKDD